MNELPKYYTLLFNAAEDAVAALRRGEPETAETLLIQGQIMAEDAYIESEK